MQPPGYCFGSRKKILDKPPALPILIAMGNNDNGLSVKSGGQVKHKLTSVPASFNTAGPLNTPPPADQPAQPAQAQDLQKSDPGAHPGSGLVLDIPVLRGGWHKGSIGVADKRILAALNAHLSKFGICNPSYSTLAHETGYCRRHVIRRVQLMKRDPTFDAKRTKKTNMFTFLSYGSAFKSIWVDPAWIQDYGMDAIDELLLGFWRREAQGTDSAWFKHEKAAEAVGVSRRTVQQRFARFETRHIFQITRRPGRGSEGNTYTLTGYGRMIIGVSEPEQNAHGCHPKVKRLEEEKLVNAPFGRRGAFSPKSGLSFSTKQDQEVYGMLRAIGIYWMVAKLIAVQWRGRTESVRNMIIIGMFAKRRHEQYWRAQGKVPPRFKLAGYVIRGLNIAMAEGHDIKLSAAAKEDQAKTQGKPRAAAGSGVTAVCHRARVKEAIRKLRSAPAKLYTPLEMAKFAEERRLRGRKAQEAFLNKAEATAQQVYFSSKKSANPAQNIGFSLDKLG